MNQVEKAYLGQIKKILSSGKTAVEMIDEMAVITNKPKTEDVSLNSKRIKLAIGDLEFEREDGELDGGSDWKGYDELEKEIAESSLETIKSTLADIEAGNFYKNRYEICLVYSKLEGTSYSYSEVYRPHVVDSKAEAKQIVERIKKTMPKQHPTNPGYTLEDIRVLEDMVDAHGKIIRLNASF